MDTERLKQRLFAKGGKTLVNKDAFLNIGLTSEQRLLPYNELNRTINVTDRFTTERNSSSLYRIIGTTNLVASNALFNLDDDSLPKNDFTWSVFNNIDLLDTSYPKDGDVYDETDLTFNLSLVNYLKEKNGWFGYYDISKINLNGFCDFLDMEPKRERFSLIPDTNPYGKTKSTSESVKNWELTITYPSRSDKTHYMVQDGLMLIESVQAIVATRQMTAFAVPCKHNLEIGDTVMISGTTSYNGEHVVVRTGLDNGDLKEYYFVIDKLPTGKVGVSSRFKKVIGGLESEYYFRIFKKIKTKNTAVLETDDYETYGLGFSKNIYEDKITQFVVNEEIDVNGLIDNLKRPLSELYLTMVKTDSNGLFTNIASGIETPFIEELNKSNVEKPFLQKIPVINKIHNGNKTPFISHIALEDNVTIEDNNSIIGNNEFYGDLVEFNVNQLREIVLADVHHRFNTTNRETNVSIDAISSLGAKPLITKISLGPRYEGYHYKAHTLIKIRNFSSYIEEGEENTFNLPDYAIKLDDDRYIWRDLLDIGINDKTNDRLDYPFLNGTHYLYQNFNFLLKRQDPFNNWNLFYGIYPSDPIGESFTDNFTTYSSDDVC